LDQSDDESNPYYGSGSYVLLLLSLILMHFVHRRQTTTVGSLVSEK